MTTEEFFKQMDSAKPLCTKISECPVKIRIQSKDGFTLSEHFTLNRANYMFNPFTGDGRLVLEIQVL